MSIGYFVDIADANDYFDLERLETSAWDALLEITGHYERSKAVTQAFNRLYFDPRWTLPDYAHATADELEILRKANAEMAYYLAVHLEAEDHRKGLQAQATTEAGVVKEKYDTARADTVPVPAAVVAMLAPWVILPTAFGIVNLERDEEESVDTKVDEF